MSITRQLEEIAGAGDDFVYQCYQLTDGWENQPKSPEVTEEILRFMEAHPDMDYGAPGPLVHFMEALSGYEGKLIESVERRPTPHTVWMLNRVINGKHDPEERRAVTLVIERVLNNPAADGMTRARALDSLEFLKTK
jgi:hypothetical protein